MERNENNNGAVCKSREHTNVLELSAQFSHACNVRKMLYAQHEAL